MNERAAAAVPIALAAGVCGAIQPKLNAVLGARVGNALVASLVNFSVALGVVVIALLLRPGTRRRLGAIRTWPVPGWTLSAGLGGAVIVVAGAVAVRTIGVAIFAVAFFAGQISFGLLVDRLGVAGGQRPITAARVQAMVLAIIAVVLSQVDRPTGELVPLLIAFVVAAGAAFAFQSAFNARITRAIGDPVAATAVNVIVGTTALAAIIAVLGIVGGIGSLRWPTEPWLYAGGALGVTVVLALAIATAALGVLRSTLAMLAAQMVTAFVVDWTVERQPPRPGVIAAAVLIIGAVAIVGRQTVVVPASGGS